MVAQDSLGPTTYEYEMEIAFVSEIYRNFDGGVFISGSTSQGKQCTMS